MKTQPEKEPMTLVTYLENGEEQVGFLQGDWVYKIVDVNPSLNITKEKFLANQQAFLIFLLIADQGLHQNKNKDKIPRTNIKKAQDLKAFYYEGMDA